MHNLSVVCMFKNESHCIKEWLEHYINRGVDHFYLIDDDSNDNYTSIIHYYINENIVELFKTKEPRYLGRKMNLYNRYILPRIKESKWLLFVDMDEYVWSPLDTDLNKVLEKCSHLGQIQIEHTIFGSNGYIKQPKEIVNSFTMRTKDIISHRPLGNYKYFINSEFSFCSLNVHHASFTNKEYENKSKVFLILGPEYFRMNHYSCQSKEYWDKIKCTRGIADNYREQKLEDFYKYDINEVEDKSLCEQNKNINKRKYKFDLNYLCFS